MRNYLTILTAHLITASSSVSVWAQVTAEEPPPKSYVMPYFIVGLGIVLGLVAVCRTSKRDKTSVGQSEFELFRDTSVTAFGRPTFWLLPLVIRLGEVLGVAVRQRIY